MLSVMNGVARCAALAACCSLAVSADALAQQNDPLFLVVTPYRSPAPLVRAGSAVTVLGGEEIRKTNPGSLVDALRQVPGLDVTETGGPGATTSVRLRGANSGHTLVLIDGARVNDPSGASGEFDFSILMPTAIERIEVLRGPQSALYGSDAIGGVVNIITKKGRGRPEINLQAEGGSYGSVSGSGTVAGAIGPWSFAASAAAQRSDGFSSYGYRIARIEERFGPLEADGYERFGGYGRIGHDAGEGVRFSLNALASTTFADYDAGFGAFPDTPAFARRRFGQIWGTAEIDALGGALTHRLQLYANRTDRTFHDFSFAGNMLPQNTTRTRSDFIGDRLGGEYTADLRLGAFGLLHMGGRIERESAATLNQAVLPVTRPRIRDIDAEQTTRSAFALWSLPVGERLSLSFGGRVDDVVNVDRFATWRMTAAYQIPEIGTKLRASAGTGGKAPTLFQLYAPFFGNPSLGSERSVGVDAGFDQILFGGRATVSATVFANRIRNLIEFDRATSRYFNIARAQTSGVEVSADAEIVPDIARLTLAYTYLRATDGLTGLTLARRPEHVGRVGLRLSPTPKWSIEPSVVLVSERFSRAGELDRLPPYARLDVYSDYRIDATWRIFARVENVTGARYQEVLNYGTTGRAFYAGIDATW